MATFDQLPAEQRAILELVVGRGQTYDELSGMLGMPPARVRDLAREALGDLAPATAARVDSDWRAQIADYVLGQQTGPEATATRGHFKRSEPARAWAYSLLDSLGHLYPNGAMPEIPEADGSAPAEAPPAPVSAGPPAAAQTAADEPTAVQPAAASASRPAAPRQRPPAGGGLSPAAAAIVRRRRIIGGALAAAVVVVVVLLIAGVFGGGDDNKNGSGTNTTTTGGASTRLLSEGVLRPVGGAKGTGIAVVIAQGNARQLVIQATKLEPTDQQSAYEVWLYNSQSDAVALGAQFTDQQGNLQGRGPVPNNWDRFNYVVLSREKVGTNPKTPAKVLLRAKLTAIPAGAQLPGATNTTPGSTTTTPGG
jgi:Sigma-70, region 4